MADEGWWIMDGGGRLVDDERKVTSRPRAGRSRRRIRMTRTAAWKQDTVMRTSGNCQEDGRKMS